jgi:pilus assembly protein CpaE
MCRLYADVDKSRVVAIVGARGGVGASTIAHNLAWSIAEQHEARTALVDFDLSFGAAAFNFGCYPDGAVADALLAPNPSDAAFLERVASKPTDRLLMLAPAPMLAHPFELDVTAVDAVIKGARRLSSFVVLDLPHTWNTWVKQTLIDADDVIIVATPDLASLRNAKAMLDQLNPARPGAEAVVALSMIGAPKRPEISFKDFTEAVGTTPVLALGFDAATFGVAEIEGRMLGEVAPASKQARAIEDLAAALTGRDAPVRKTFTVRFGDASSPPPEVAYLADLRDAARARIAAPSPRPRKQSSGFSRIAAAALGLFVPVLFGSWLINQSEAATPPSAQHASPR